VQIEYRGFTHPLSGIRRYEFHGTELKRQPLVFVLSIEIALFPKHQLSIQDGPAICLQILAKAQSDGEVGRESFQGYTITTLDVEAYAATLKARSAAKSALHKRRTYAKPQPSSQLYGL